MKAVRLLEHGGQLVFNDVPSTTIARDEIERFDSYPALNIMLKQMGAPPDFASVVWRSAQR